MPGGGTRTAITTNNPIRCLDLTRLISRVGRGPFTGVDRVEMAYLRHFLQLGDPFFVLVRTGLGYVLLDHSGARQIADRLQGSKAWGPVDLIGRLSFKASLAKKRAEADLRRVAIGRCRRGALAQLLDRHVPKRSTYFNTGHSNLGEETLTSWRTHGSRIAVLVHDMIPLDHPDFQRPGTPAAFAEKMQRVAKYHDLVICNSRQTQKDVTRWFGTWGQEAKTIVAHLGIERPKPGSAALPKGLDPSKPVFVMLGTIEPRKNHKLMLDVWDSIAREMTLDKMPSLVIIGSRGWENQTVFDRLDSNPLMNSSIFEYSNLPDEAVRALMQQAAAVLFPSFAEGYGLPPAEALLLGAPVICSDLAVFREILGNNPVYLKPDDVYSWKQSIIGSTKLKRAGQRLTSEFDSDITLPTWADHFNLALIHG